MHVGIIGYGVVGRALAVSLTKHGHTVYANDVTVNNAMAEDMTTYKKLFVASKGIIAQNCEVIFICVPTPTHILRKFLDIRIVASSIKLLLKEVKECKTNPIIVVKSTMPIGFTDSLSVLMDYPLCYNPEFLRQKTALDDTMNPDRIIIGMPNSFEGVTKLIELYNNFDCKIYIVSNKIAEMAKMFSNAFLATKVAFSQQILKACDKFNVGYFPIELLTDDPRMGKTHLDPYLGKIPKNSPCLPKDLLNLYTQMDDPDGFFLEVFSEAIENEEVS